MRKRIQAAVMPGVLVAAVAGAAGYRAQDSRSRRRLDEPGDPNAVNPSSGAGRKYQVLASTRSGYGAYATAQDAPESVRDERFNQVWAGGAGSSHWGC